jgi:hypothetical protein
VLRLPAPAADHRRRVLASSDVTDGSCWHAVRVLLAVLCAALRRRSGEQLAEGGPKRAGPAMAAPPPPTLGGSRSVLWPGCCGGLLLWAVGWLLLAAEPSNASSQGQAAKSMEAATTSVSQRSQQPAKALSRRYCTFWKPSQPSQRMACPAEAASNQPNCFCFLLHRSGSHHSRHMGPGPAYMRRGPYEILFKALLHTETTINIPSKAFRYRL